MARVPLVEYGTKRSAGRHPRARFDQPYRDAMTKTELTHDEWSDFTDWWKRIGAHQRRRRARHCHAQGHHHDILTPLGKMCLRCVRYLPRDE